MRPSAGGFVDAQTRSRIIPILLNPLVILVYGQAIGLESNSR